MKVSIVGATGIVGRELLRVLEIHRFPVTSLRAFSSGRRPSGVRFRGKTLPAPAVSQKELVSSDLVFLLSNDAVSKRYAPALQRAGVWTIDESAAFRMRKDVPLVIPEVNKHVLSPKRKLIAGPNCTVTGLAVAANALHRRATATAIRIASYQAVSGAGRDALIEFVEQTRRAGRTFSRGCALPNIPRLAHAAFPQPISLNILPHVGKFDAQGESAEERKIREELRKLWEAPRLRVAATTVRVPVLRGHSLAIWIETRHRLTPGAARKLLKSAPGVRLWNGNTYPTVYRTANTDPVHVGRIRKSGASANELALWVVSDNLLKGAALNSLHIAEVLLKKGWLNRI